MGRRWGNCRHAQQAESQVPKGPKGQKRPADVIGNAVKVMRIVTGEETEDEPIDEGKDAAAVRAHVRR